MKYRMTFLILIFVGISNIIAQEELHERYHTYEEIQAQLELWNEQFGNNAEPSPAYPGSGIIYKLEEIGISSTDGLPFWGVKLSYNADVKEDEARVLFLGQCHAEEIYGIEIAMEIIRMVLEPTPPITNLKYILQNAEIWVVPTHNPEGLRVVHGYEEDGEWIQDVAYRKNRRDVDFNGIFNFVEGVGNDSDGVDLNRNYDFNWFRGDELWEGDPSPYQAHYDYYKGEYPFSELELQGIRDFVDDKHFLLSIAYHSSRSGNVSEQVIYSWDWEGAKYPPDFPVINTIGQTIANLIPTETGTDFQYYIPVAGSSRKGSAHDWFYAKDGCVQYLIETGTENLQSDNVDLIEDTIERNLRGAYYLMNRAVGYDSGEYGAEKYQITGHVFDAQTSVPIQDAFVKIVEMDGMMLENRVTDEFGRYRRLLVPGTYNIEIDKRGYEKQNLEFTPSSSVITVEDFYLEPLNEFQLTLILDSPSPVEITVVDEYGEMNYSNVESSLQIVIPENSYHITVFGENLFSQFIDVSLNSNITLDVDIDYSEIVFEDDFNNLDNWEIITGDWIIEDGCLLSQSEIIYPDNNILIRSNTINLTDVDELEMKLNFQYELEWENDSLFVRFIGEQDTSEILWNDQNWVLHEENHPISISGESMFIEIELRPDYTVEYRGLKIDQLSIYKGQGNVVSNDNSIIPIKYSLFQNHPNPFNPVTTITYQLPAPCSVLIAIYNIQGQLVEQLVDSREGLGYHEVVWDADNFASGIYLYKLTTDDFTSTKKLLLLK